MAIDPMRSNVTKEEAYNGMVAFTRTETFKGAVEDIAMRMFAELSAEAAKVTERAESTLIVLPESSL